MEFTEYTEKLDALRKQVAELTAENKILLESKPSWQKQGSKHSGNGRKGRCGDCGGRGNRTGSLSGLSGQSSPFGEIDYYSCDCGNSWNEIERAW